MPSVCFLHDRRTHFDARTLEPIQQRSADPDARLIRILNLQDGRGERQGLGSSFPRLNDRGGGALLPLGHRAAKGCVELIVPDAALCMNVRKSSAQLTVTGWALQVGCQSQVNRGSETKWQPNHWRQKR